VDCNVEFTSRHRIRAASLRRRIWRMVVYFGGQSWASHMASLSHSQLCLGVLRAESRSGEDAHLPVCQDEGAHRPSDRHHLCCHGHSIRHFADVLLSDIN